MTSTVGSQTIPLLSTTYPMGRHDVRPAAAGLICFVESQARAYIFSVTGAAC